MVAAGDVLARLERALGLEADLASAQAALLEAEQALADLQDNAGASLAQSYQALVSAQAAHSEALAASQRAEGARCSEDVLAKYQSALRQAGQALNDAIQNDPGGEARTIAGYDYDTALANTTYCMSYTSTEKSSAQAALAVAQAGLQAAEEEYKTLKAASGIDPRALSQHETRVENARTRLATAQEALDGTVLVAPIAGKVTALAASAGAIVDTATFLTISDVSQPRVTVSLDETDMDKLAVGNAAQVTFTALPGQVFAGKVSAASPEMQEFGPFRAASGQVTLDAEAARALANLPLGLSASVTITGREAVDALLVPVEALKGLSSGEYAVTLVDSSGQASEQVVSVGLQDETSAEITGGLKEGDVVRYAAPKNPAGAGDEFAGPGEKVIFEINGPGGAGGNVRTAP
jgi:RND family efflux transporter MFP subunit